MEKNLQFREFFGGKGVHCYLLGSENALVMEKVLRRTKGGVVGGHMWKIELE